MFMDRYLWNLQFGSSRIVPKKRASGAPIDGVVVSAGIPRAGRSRGPDRVAAGGRSAVREFPSPAPWIRFARSCASPRPYPHHHHGSGRGGEAGGHHSWKRWTTCFAATYAGSARLRTTSCWSGGIGTPNARRTTFSGQWAHAYGLPDMPVDGVLSVPAAMTAKEAHTSPEVKQLFVKTPGIPATPSPMTCSPRRPPTAPSGKSVGGIVLRPGATCSRHLRARERSSADAAVCSCAS